MTDVSYDAEAAGRGYRKRVEYVQDGWWCNNPITVTPGIGDPRPIGQVACGTCESCKNRGVELKDVIIGRTTDIPAPKPRVVTALPYPVRRFLEQIAAYSDRPLTAAEAQRQLDRFDEIDNVSKAALLVKEITDTQNILRVLKSAFAKDELDGGYKAAMDHPLHKAAAARVVELQEELKGLI